MSNKPLLVSISLRGWNTLLTKIGKKLRKWLPSKREGWKIHQWDKWYCFSLGGTHFWPCTKLTKMLCKWRPFKKKWDERKVNGKNVTVSLAFWWTHLKSGLIVNSWILLSASQRFVDCNYQFYCCTCRKSH